MAEQGFDCKLRQDGSIDFDAYRAEAARERREARDYLLWEVVAPLIWGAPLRLIKQMTLKHTTKVIRYRGRGWSAKHP